jgi:hypothetical protein
LRITLILEVHSNKKSKLIIFFEFEFVTVTLNLLP